MAKGIRVEIDPLTWPTLTADLTHEEVRALLGLMMACALNGTGAVPDDDAALAGLTGLGDRWKDSRLRDRGVLARWFDLEDGLLYARDLVEEMARREEWLAKSRRGGAASAATRAARRATTAATKVATLLPTKVATLVGSKVEAPLETAAAPAPPPPTPAATETHVPQGETAAQGAGAPPPDCTPPPSREEAVEPCAQAEGALRETAHGAPPHNPPYSVAQQHHRFSSPKEEENARLLQNDTGRVGGPGGGEGTGGPDSLDLFGDPLPRPKASHRPRVTRAHMEAATRLIGAYQEKVRAWHRPGRRAAPNAAWWLSRGIPEATLLRAVENYGAVMDAGDIDYPYRLSAQNFFARQHPPWQTYEKTPEVTHERAAPKTAAQRREEKYRAKLAEIGRELDGVG